MKDDLLFVYGTLRRDARNAIAQLLARRADFVGAATVQGGLYLVEEYPGAVASDDPADRVRGEVWRLREPAAVLAELDDYEACGPSFPSPTEYNRRVERATLQSGEHVAAWIYLYQRPTDGLRRIESGDFAAGR